jgi:hypothetical protein
MSAVFTATTRCGRALRKLFASHARPDQGAEVAPLIPPVIRAWCDWTEGVADRSDV